jgi:hypothetical protein
LNFNSKSHIVVVVSDLHTNSTVGLLPAHTILDDGLSVGLGKPQLWVYQKWTDFWDYVYDLKNQIGATVVTIANGELADNLQYRTTQLVTLNTADILSMVESVWTNAREITDHLIVTRGTAAHSGPSACLDELAAKALEAEPFERHESRSIHSWWHFDGIIGGLNIQAAHHPQTAGRLPHTMQAAVMRQSFMIELQCTRSNRPIPDVAIRSHIHYAADSGIYTRPRTFYTWGWQLTPEFGHRLGTAQYARPIGGLILVIRDGKLTIDNSQTFQLERNPPWTLPA